MTKTIKIKEVQEAILRERKKTALIVKGIPENGKDREEIQRILDTLEMTEEFKHTPQLTRVGKQNDRGKSRPIKLECETTDQMLKRSTALAMQESTRDVGLYIGPDLTRKERLANKDLHEELKARGEENIFIRRNEIVTSPLLLLASPLLAAPQAAAPVAHAGSSASTKKLSTNCKKCNEKTHTAQLTQEINLGSTPHPSTT